MMFESFGKSPPRFSTLFIMINIAYGLLLQLIYTVHSRTKPRQDCYKNYLSCTKVFFLAIFKIMPFIQLSVSFLAESLTGQIDIKLYVALCISYPFLMGGIQKLTSKINDDNEFKMDLIAEAYSLFFAALPYKLIYLQIDMTWIIISVISIKATFKLIAYILIPYFKVKKFKEKNLREKSIRKNKIEIISSIAEMPNSQNLDNLKNNQPQKKNRVSQIPNTTKRVNKNFQRKPGRRSSTRIQSILEFFSEEVRDSKMFSIKFFILQVFDITSNIAVFNLIITAKFIAKPILGYSPMLFPPNFIGTISFWTTVSFGLILKVELLLDLGYLVGCFRYYKRVFFNGNIQEIFRGIKNFEKHYKWNIPLASYILFTICYYIVFYVVNKDLVPT